MSLAEYLAKNYLTASNDPTDLSTRPKKRRKKDKPAETGLIVADDDDSLVISSTHTTGQEDDDRPIYDTTVQSAEFRKSKKNNWKSVGSTATFSDPARTNVDPDADDKDAADRILAAAAAENDRRHAEIEMEDAPAVVDDVAAQTSSGAPRMSSGARAGLQTAADTAVLEAEEEQQRRKAERESRRQKKQKSGAEAEHEQTVYRDATGRRIDVSMKRAEARAAEAERQRLERAEKESAMGAVQLAERETRRQAEKDAQFLTVARHADDEDMNEELRRQIRWDDPMAGYMARRGEEEETERQSTTAVSNTTRGTKVKGRKEYPGPGPPNRYSIRPGWRWDGVDRGNGFEKEWFQARSRKTRNENLSYQMLMDE